VNFPILLAQFTPGQPLTPWRMIADGTLSTQLVLAVLAIFSFVSWVLLLWKFFQFRRLGKEADRYLFEMERAERLDEAYRMVMALPESAFSRVFRRGMSFFSELRPNAFAAGGAVAVAGLSPTQLEVLRLVLEKEEAEERDELAHGIHWLGVVATVAPLLGLLGTVLGVMNSFIGVAAAGSANISAVAPGVAEALITTVAGLVVAIPAAIGYNYFVNRLSLFMGELEGFSSEFIGTLAREGKL
jgi:biopolymer transport protein TolQ